MTRLATLTLILALAAQAAAAGPAEVSAKRPKPRPMSAAEAACLQFTERDRVQRPQPVSLRGSIILSTHGPR